MFVTYTELRKSYQQQLVVDIPSLAIQQGEITGMLGPNGAGKTTLFQLTLDLIPADSGGVVVNGIPVSTADAYKAQIGSYLDENFLIDFLTPDEYFSFQAQLRNWDKDTLAAYLSRWENIFNGEILGRKRFIRELSKGNKSKVGVAAALIGFPALVILDEPFANIDPGGQQRLIQLLKEINAEHNTTFILSSHDLRQATKVCERIIILQKGKVVHDVRTQEETLATLESLFLDQPGGPLPPSSVED